MQGQQESISASNGFIANWKSRVDDLATRLMISGGGSDTILELRGIGDEARLFHADECAQVVDSLIARLEQDLRGGTTYLLSQGVDDLRNSITTSGPSAPTASTPASLGEDAELVSDFLVEAREHLSQIEGQMLILERDPSAMEVIHTVFRAFHTIKGLAGFLDFTTVQALAHEVETLLDMARNEKLVITSSIVDVVLESGDSLQVELGSIEHALNTGGAVVSADNGALVRKIRTLAVPLLPGQELVNAKASASTKPMQDKQEEMLDFVFEAAAVEAEPTPSADKKPAKNAVKPTKRVRGTKNIAAKGSESATPEESPTLQAVHDATPSNAEVVVAPAAESAESAAGGLGKSFETKDGKGFVKLYSAADRAALMSANQTGAAKSIEKPEAVVPPAPGEAAPAPIVASTIQKASAEAARPASPPAAQAKDVAKSADASSVRVETEKLDHLMDMVGEIVIAQSLIRHNQAFASATDSRLMADLAQLARVTNEVQRATMSMRMVPMGQLFQRVERVIRDLSRKAGKQVVLETSGTETEIDKTVAEELSDPLMHMVRNSVDHGIEPAAERVAAGKTAEARIKLSARHQGGQVVIEISDDGRGLNSEKIRCKAEERHLVSANAVLSENETFQLIFEPGFSTAEKVTDVSGRGVGMDVVRRNVEKLRGSIEIQSVFGQGTTFALKLPLTLAIIDGLVVEVGTDRYIIPLSGVREIFRPQPDKLFTLQGHDEMLLVRGQLIPVVRLGQRLGIEGRASKPSEGLIVVVESQNKCFCLLIDDLLGKQEVVIKSLGETFKDVSGLSGCAVLGDGRVGLILDMNGIYRGGR